MKRGQDRKPEPTPHDGVLAAIDYLMATMPERKDDSEAEHEQTTPKE